MKTNAIYKIKKVEDNQTREFEITFSEKLNVWVCYELITLDNGEIDSKIVKSPLVATDEKIFLDYLNL